jgi:hypothetical protein
MKRTDEHVQNTELKIPHAASFDGTVTSYETRCVLRSEDMNSDVRNQFGWRINAHNTLSGFSSGNRCPDLPQVVSALTSISTCDMVLSDRHSISRGN